MRLETEKRLHRVKITLDNKNVLCPKSENCVKAENCNRCNKFYSKCAIYLKNS